MSVKSLTLCCVYCTQVNFPSNKVVLCGSLWERFKTSVSAAFGAAWKNGINVTVVTEVCNCYLYYFWEAVSLWRNLFTLSYFIFFPSPPSVIFNAAWWRSKNVICCVCISVFKHFVGVSWKWKNLLSHCKCSMSVTSVCKIRHYRSSVKMLLWQHRCGSNIYSYTPHLNAENGQKDLTNRSITSPDTPMIHKALTTSLKDLPFVSFLFYAIVFYRYRPTTHHRSFIHNLASCS